MKKILIIVCALFVMSTSHAQLASNIRDTIEIGLYLKDTLCITTGAQNGYVLTSDINGVGRWLPNSGGGADSIWIKNGSGIVEFDSTQKVGIGNTNPRSNIEVNGTLGLSGISTIKTIDSIPLHFSVFNVASGIIQVGDFFNTGYGLNTSYGYHSFANFINDTTSYGNTAIGAGSQGFGTSGYWNTSVGLGALASVVNAGFGNNAFGKLALFNLTSGWRNCAFGSDVMLNEINGSYNCSFGNQSLSQLIGGEGNCAFGGGTLSTITQGYYVSVFGAGGSCNDSLSFSTGIGAYSYPKLSNQLAISDSMNKLYMYLNGGAPGTVLVNDGAGNASWQPALGQPATQLVFGTGAGVISDTALTYASHFQRLNVGKGCNNGQIVTGEVLTQDLQISSTSCDSSGTFELDYNSNNSQQYILPSNSGTAGQTLVIDGSNSHKLNWQAAGGNLQTVTTAGNTTTNSISVQLLSITGDNTGGGAFGPLTVDTTGGVSLNNVINGSTTWSLLSTGRIIYLSPYTSQQFWLSSDSITALRKYELPDVSFGMGSNLHTTLVASVNGISANAQGNVIIPQLIYSDTIISPASGGSFTCPSNQTGVIFTTGSTLVTFTLVLPPNPFDGFRFTCISDPNTPITTLTYSTSDGSSIDFPNNVSHTQGSPRTILVYNKRTNTWY